MSCQPNAAFSDVKLWTQRPYKRVIAIPSRAIFSSNYIYIYLNVYKYGHTTKVYPMSSLTAQRMICRCKGASFSSRTRLAHNKCLGVRPVFFSEQHEPGNVKITQPGQGKKMKHVTLRNKHAGSTGSGIQSAQNGDVQQ